jgi:dTDP-4-dehydrorhamnose 3,5-epimerase
LKAVTFARGFETHRFTLLDTPISDLKVIERQQLGDHRGFLSRLFCAEELVVAGWHKPVAQINQTVTRVQGTVRGLHFQRAPHAEMKLITCLRGAVWDVAVDLRAGSPTFLQWHALELSETNRYAMLIPEGFAHGFQTLLEDCELIYLHSMPYAPEAEAGLNARDPTLSIRWPLPMSDLSARDLQHPMLGPKFKGVRL